MPYIKQIGKQGKINIKANRILERIYEEKGITNCEICYNWFGLSFAHRHLRDWYKEKGRQELLWSFNETLLTCLKCHQELEKDKELTEETFNELRNL